MTNEHKQQLLKSLMIAVHEQELGVMDSKLKDGRSVVVLLAARAGHAGEPGELCPLAALLDIDAATLIESLDDPGEEIMRCRVIETGADTEIKTNLH